MRGFYERVVFFLFFVSVCNFVHLPNSARADDLAGIGDPGPAEPEVQMADVVIPLPYDLHGELYGELYGESGWQDSTTFVDPAIGTDALPVEPLPITSPPPETSEPAVPELVVPTPSPMPRRIYSYEDLRQIVGVSMNIDLLASLADGSWIASDETIILTGDEQFELRSEALNRLSALGEPGNMWIFASFETGETPIPRSVTAAALALSEIGVRLLLAVVENSGWSPRSNLQFNYDESMRIVALATLANPTRQFPGEDRLLYARILSNALADGSPRVRLQTARTLAVPRIVELLTRGAAERTLVIDALLSRMTPGIEPDEETREQIIRTWSVYSSPADLPELTRIVQQSEGIPAVLSALRGIARNANAIIASSDDDPESPWNFVIAAVASTRLNHASGVVRVEARVTLVEIAMSIMGKSSSRNPEEISTSERNISRSAYLLHLAFQDIPRFEESYVYSTIRPAIARNESGLASMIRAAERPRDALELLGAFEQGILFPEMVRLPDEEPVSFLNRLGKGVEHAIAIRTREFIYPSDDVLVFQAEANRLLSRYFDLLSALEVLPENELTRIGLLWQIGELLPRELTVDPPPSLSPDLFPPPSWEMGPDPAP